MNNLPDGYIAHLPPPKQRPPHLFGDPLPVAQDPVRGRHQQTERTCAVCNLVKVTVHRADGFSWREWRLPGSAFQVPLEKTPLCTVAAP